MNEIKLKNNKYLSPVNHQTNNILSTNNESSKKYVKFFISNEKIRINRNNIIIQSPSVRDIKTNIIKFENKNDSIINNINKLKNNLLNKNDNDKPLTINRFSKKHTFYKLLPLNLISQYNENYQRNNYKKNSNIKSNSNISKEKNFLEKLNDLYFNKKSEKLLENAIDNEKENNIFNKLKIKKEFNLRNDIINNSYNSNHMSEKNFTNLKNMDIYYLNNINKKKITLKSIKPLNLIKSNSYNHFIIDKTNNFF